jgi:hypothetical protein
MAQTPRRVRRTSADPSLSSTTTYSSTASSESKPASTPAGLSKVTRTAVAATIITPTTPEGGPEGGPDYRAAQARKSALLGLVRGFLPQRTTNKMCIA